MKRSFSAGSKAKPEGMLRACRFPQLAMMGVETGDGRLLESAGGGVRELPRTIFAQFAQEGAHMGSVPIGRLDTVEMDDESGVVSGDGWLVDLPHVRDVFVPLIVTKTLRGNSIDMAEVTVELRWKSDDPDSPEFWEYTLVFTKWNVAATTVVGVPAFPDASIELDEVTASLLASDEPLEWSFDDTVIRIVNDEMEEITASMAVAEATVPYADFHIPEAAKSTKIQVDEQGRIFGHLAEWGQCHQGIEDRCVLAPRPDSYDEYDEPSVLTDRGMVGTGPIFFLGGHPEKPIGNGDRWKAYGGIENAWGDVRVTNGQIGPWVSGRVRPGLSAEALYAARASRISGHWRTNGSLGAIVSCNLPGFRTGSGTETRAALQLPNSELFADRDGVVIRDGEVVEMVASLRSAESAPEVPTPGVAYNTSSHSFTSVVQGELADGNTKPFVDAAMEQRREQLAAAGAVISTVLAEATADHDDDDDDDFLFDLELDEIGELPMDSTANEDS